MHTKPRALRASTAPCPTKLKPRNQPLHACSLPCLRGPPPAAPLCAPCPSWPAAPVPGIMPQPRIKPPACQYPDPAAKHVPCTAAPRNAPGPHAHWSTAPKSVSTSSTMRATLSVICAAQPKRTSGLLANIALAGALQCVLGFRVCHHPQQPIHRALHAPMLHQHSPPRIQVN
jgi:hypothetical protein